MMTRASAACTCHSVLITNIFSICFFVKVLCVVVVLLLLLLLLLLCGKKNEMMVTIIIKRQPNDNAPTLAWHVCRINGGIGASITIDTYTSTSTVANFHCSIPVVSGSCDRGMLLNLCAKRGNPFKRLRASSRYIEVRSSI